MSSLDLGMHAKMQTPPEDVLTEILLRLPSESILRFRVVSKNWHRITATRCRPLELLLSTRKIECSTHIDGPDVSMDSLNAVPVAAADEGRRPRRLLEHSIFVRYRKLGAGLGAGYGRGYSLFASCDGLLLFTQFPHYGMLLLCNPTSRRWTRLALQPPACSWVTLSGFYFHRPSGEYRVLCHGGDRGPTDAAHYILSVGAAEPRLLRPVSENAKCVREWPSRPVTVRQSLHWLKHTEGRKTGSIPNKMVAFDTVAETFRLMPLPPSTGTVCDVSLFDLDGALAASSIRETVLDVWVLEDYDVGGKWMCRFQLEIPWLHGRRRFVSMLGVGGWEFVIMDMDSAILYDLKAKRILREVGLGAPTGFLFRESLVGREFLPLLLCPSEPLFRFS